MAIKIFIISAGAQPAVVAGKNKNEYLCKFDEGYAQRFIKHLDNAGDACTACGKECVSCRAYLVDDLSGKIAGHLKLPVLTDQFIDDPEEYFPDEFPPHDVTIAINIHSDLLIEAPKLASAAGSKALIAPVEDPDWLGEWTKNKLKDECDRLGLEFAAPKPFCDLSGDGYVYIKKFIEEFKVGRPALDLIIEGGVVRKATVITSAPCGATYYLAHLFEGMKADHKITETACKGLSCYPCTASTKVDPEFKDSITHRANYIMIDIVKELIEIPTAG